MQTEGSQEEAVHNFLDEVTSEVSIHILLVVQRSSFLWLTAFFCES